LGKRLQKLASGRAVYQLEHLKSPATANPPLSSACNKVSTLRRTSGEVLRVRVLRSSPSIAAPNVAKFPYRRHPRPRFSRDCSPDLDSDQFATRAKANEDLATFGAANRGELRKTLTRKTSPEVRRSVETLLQALESGRRFAVAGDLRCSS